MLKIRINLYVYVLPRSSSLTKKSAYSCGRANAVLQTQETTGAEKV